MYPVAARCVSRREVARHNNELKLTKPSVTRLAGPKRLAQQGSRRPSSQLNSGVIGLVSPTQASLRPEVQLPQTRHSLNRRFA